MSARPEAQWIVTLDAERIAVTDAAGAVRALAKADLSAAMIETSDGGPADADFWWLLFGPDRRLAAAFPQGATGEQAAVDWLMALPGFDFEAMIRASSSVENAFFPVWEKKA